MFLSMDMLPLSCNVLLQDFGLLHSFIPFENVSILRQLHCALDSTDGWTNDRCSSII